MPEENVNCSSSIFIDAPPETAGHSGTRCDEATGPSALMRDAVTLFPHTCALPAENLRWHSRCTNARREGFAPRSVPTFREVGPQSHRSGGALDGWAIEGERRVPPGQRRSSFPSFVQWRAIYGAICSC